MISILFATHNGTETLPRMFESLKQQDLPFRDSQWEIIVVDNNSSDGTSELINSYIPGLPIKLISEPRQGKNCALNTGLKAVSGEYIVLTDDDIIAKPDWLSQYKKLFDKHEDIDIFGGKTLPNWPSEPSRSLLTSIPITVVYALTNPDTHKTGNIDPCKLLGPNMAVRTKVFDLIQFNENIGPSGTNYVMGSETDFLHRAKEADCAAYFSENVEVQHIIRENQMTDKWLQGRAYKAGRALVHDKLRKGTLNKDVRLIGGRPVWALRRLVTLRMKWYSSKALSSIGSNPKNYKIMWDAWFIEGYLYEHREVVLGHSTNINPI